MAGSNTAPVRFHSMFDVDTFIEECITARGEADPRQAIKEVLAKAMSEPDEVAATLPPERAEIVRLHASPELTIIKVVSYNVERVLAYFEAANTTL